MTENTLFLCLDSCRYDTFTEAKTPNMDSIGKAKLVHSFACWTLPSIIGYLTCYPPIGAELKRLFDAPKQKWVPLHYNEKKYTTAFLSPNEVIPAFDIGVNGAAFKKSFKHFLYNYPENKGTPQLLEDALAIIQSENNPLFIFMLLMATHRPYFDGKKTEDIDPKRPDWNFKNQVKSIEYVDSLFTKLLEALEETGRKTIITITSDHGELFGPRYYSHDPSTPYLRFDPKLYEIPFVRGKK